MVGKISKLVTSSIIPVLALSLSLVSCSSGGEGGTVNILGVSWTAPTEREDGSVLAVDDIASFRIYYGVTSGDYQNQVDVDDGFAKSSQVVDLAPGTYYVVITAVDRDERESVYSSEVVITL